MGGTESKLEYRRGIMELKRRHVLPSEDFVWTPLLNFVAKGDVIYSLLSPSDVRTMKEVIPNNLAVFIRKNVDVLERVSWMTKPLAESIQACSNALAVISRVMPIIFENQSDDFHTRLFWEHSNPSDFEPLDSDHGIPFSVHGAAGSPLETAFEPPSEEVLGSRLAAALTRLLFVPGFCVNDGGVTAPSGLPLEWTLAHVWAPGLGMEATMPADEALVSHRCEVLRALLSILSEQMYVTPGTFVDRPLRFQRALVSGPGAALALPIFRSLLNTLTSYDPVGWGVPYNYVVSGSVEEESLVDLSVQVLLALLDYDMSLGESVTAPSTLARPPSSDGIANPPNASGGGGGGDGGTGGGGGGGGGGASVSGGRSSKKNVYRSIAAEVSTPTDCSLVVRGLLRLLRNPLDASTTYLPGSTKVIGCYQELMILFWKLIEENKAFMMHVLRSRELLDLVVALVYYMLEGRRDSGRLGLVHVAVFAFLLLSGERNFGVRLNEPFVLTGAFSALEVFTGNHADLLILAFHKIVVDGSPRLVGLYDCLLTVLVNVSPYTMSLSMVASAKLVTLFKLFTSPQFLMLAEGNQHLVFLCFEVFNNIIQYQFDGNLHLVYAIIQGRQLFENLARLSINAFHRSMRKKEEAVLKSTTVIGSTGSSGASSTLLPAHSSRGVEDGSGVGEGGGRGGGDGGGGGGGRGEGGGASGSRGVGPSRSQDGLLGALSTSSTAPDLPGGEEPCSGGPGDGVLVSDIVRARSSLPPFVTTAWLRSWKARLPLATCHRLLQIVVPQVEKLCLENGLTDMEQVLAFLRNGTLVGLLPVPHPIVVRKYQPNSSTSLWFTTLLWSVLYLRLTHPPLFYGTEVALFEVTMEDGNGSGGGSPRSSSTTPA